MRLSWVAPGAMGIPYCSINYILYHKRGCHKFTIFKTDSGFREVDLCPTLAAMLKGYMDKREKTLKSDLLFQSKPGKPLHQCNILRRTLHPILENFNEPKCAVTPSGVSALHSV
jgi:hypothetical protein